MTVSERTYSFRGSKDLGARVREAVRTWDELLGSQRPDLDEAIRAFSIDFVRTSQEARRGAKTQSALLRAALEAFAGATEKIASDLRAVAEYEAWAREDEEAAAVRAAALAAAADRWRED